MNTEEFGNACMDFAEARDLGVIVSALRSSVLWGSAFPCESPDGTRYLSCPGRFPPCTGIWSLRASWFLRKCLSANRETSSLSWTVVNFPDCRRRSPQPWGVAFVQH